MFKKVSLAAFTLLLASLTARCQQPATTSIPMNNVSGLSAVIGQLNTSIANLQSAINGLNATTKITGEVVGGTINGLNAVFQLKYVPSPGQGVLVYRNGIRQAVGSDYTLSGTTITFATGAIPQIGDAVLADYVTAPQALPSVPSLAFGNGALYAPATVQTVTFSNPGPAAAVFSSWTLVGSNAASYSISTNTCGLSLAAGATCNVAIAFNSSQVGPLAATLVANDNAAGSPQMVSLSGTGVLVMPSSWASIVSATNASCVDVVGQNVSNGSATSLNSCDGLTSQAFQFAPVSGGYEVTEQSSNIQLDVTGGPNNYADNSVIGLYSFWGGSNEVWNTQPTPDGFFIVTVNNSGKCMTATGTSVVTDACSGATSQKWSLIPVSH